MEESHWSWAQRSRRSRGSPNGKNQVGRGARADPTGRTQAPSPDCPVEVALAAIAGRWTTLVLRNLMSGDAYSYTELAASLPSLSDKVLSDRLNALVLRRPCGTDHQQRVPTANRIPHHRPRQRTTSFADRAVPHRPGSPSPRRPNRPLTPTQHSTGISPGGPTAAPKARRLRKYCASSPISRSLGSHDCQYWRPHPNDQPISGPPAHSAVRGNVARTVRPWESPVHDQVAVRASTVEQAPAALGQVGDVA